MTAEMRCVASIVGSYGWHRVLAIYEQDGYFTNYEILALLSDELQAVGSEIELRLIFPPFSTLSNPKALIRKELEQLNRVQSRVFIIIGSSLELASYIISEAKETEIMGKDSVWITLESITNLFHSVSSSLMSSMQGIIGIKTYFSDETEHFQSFSNEFSKQFLSVYPKEVKSQPGIDALRAYDSISTLLLALEKVTDNSSTTNSRMVLQEILSSKADGLSGEIKYQNRELSRSMIYEIVNVFGASYNRLKYWSPEFGFSDHVTYETSSGETNSSGGSMHALGDGVRVHWPGGLERVPKGWVISTDAKPIVIGVPENPAFEKFVQWNDGDPIPTGFCIQLFYKSVQLLGYDLQYTFKKIPGEYGALVDQVYYEDVDAVVGDITILSNRSKYVDFTQPYAESGLTIVVPVRVYEREWLFVKLFTATLWLGLTSVFVYTMSIIWFLEHRSNPEFKGPRKNQLSAAMWFTFSTLFFAHRERLRSSYTRVVMFVWLFVVFVIISSYQASLTSMLTVQRLEPTVTDIESLKKSNFPVGCDGNSFLAKYLVEALGFDPKNVVHIHSLYDYPEAFKNGTIKAAFLGLPYERIFLSMNTNSKDFKDTGIKHRFGGLGFAFRKGSPMARDFSNAFLKLSEEGTLNKLHQEWFALSAYSDSDNSMSEQRLSFKDFRVLFLVTVITSTLMLLLYTVLGRRSGPPADSDDRVSNVGILMSSEEESASHDTPGTRQPAPITSIEMQNIGNPESQTRPLRVGLANSFPAPGRHIHGHNHAPGETF